jgi:hypothetical protein
MYSTGHSENVIDNAGEDVNNANSNQQLNDAKFPRNVERMFETFHQSPNGDFKPTHYNPFEIKHRRRTTKAQYKILERSFNENQKPSANIRRSLATKLDMTPRAVQVWFQNRRAKTKGNCPSSGKPLLPSAASLTGGLASPDLSRSNSSSDLSLASNYATPLTGNAMKKMAADSEIDSKSNTEVFNTGNPNILRNRANSCPSIELPFKQLHDALFGSINNPSYTSNPPLNESSEHSSYFARPRSNSNTSLAALYPSAIKGTYQHSVLGVPTPFISPGNMQFTYPNEYSFSQPSPPPTIHHQQTSSFFPLNHQPLTQVTNYLPIDPSLLTSHHSNNYSLEEVDGGEEYSPRSQQQFGGNDEALNLEFFSPHHQNGCVVPCDGNIDLVGMMGNSEAFLMSLVDDHHIIH